MDAISEARLTLVCPVLADKTRVLSEMFVGEFPTDTLRVTAGYRTMAEQAAEWAQGRTTPGPIVTNAQPGYSWHEFGLAVDIVPMMQSGQPDWNESHPNWQRVLAMGASLGLTEGAHFHSRPDGPHLQLTGTFPVTPNDEARQILKNEGIQAVWEAAGL